MRKLNRKIHQDKELDVDRKTINRRDFISFATFLAASVGAWRGWRWLYGAPLEKPGVTAYATKPLRTVLDRNESIFRKFFSAKNLVKTYPKSMAVRDARVNGNIGIDDDNFDPGTWALAVSRLNGEVEVITLETIRSLPREEIVYSFKCVEGWDEIQHWAGVRFCDFVAHFGLEKEVQLAYVGMETPDQAYYVGIDTESAMHPQTILAYELNDQPLTQEHGAPLRLIIPVKYGIKNLKRIGLISFHATRPRDFWAEQGYDYYSGL